MNKLTEQQIKDLGWMPGEVEALVNTETLSMFLTSTTYGVCAKEKERMTSQHPLYAKMEVVKNPNAIN